MEVHSTDKKKNTGISGMHLVHSIKSLADKDPKIDSR
jgi:hypothetical protein